MPMLRLFTRLLTIRLIHVHPEMLLCAGPDAEHTDYPQGIVHLVENGEQNAVSRRPVTVD